MRAIPVLGVAISLAVASSCLAQEWEVGGAAGFGIYRNATVRNGSGSASAGFDNGFAAGVVIGQDLYDHFSGEVRYTFRDGDLKLSQSGQKAVMNGDSHAIHYDVLLHAMPRSARVRPYAAVGGGIRLFRGTGKESASQPLSDFALLTRTEEVKPLISVGGGVKFMVNSKTAIRVDLRDYISPSPEKLLVAAPGAKLSGWLNDVVPMVGVSFVF